MQYSNKQMQEIKSRILRKISYEIDNAFDNDCIDEVLNKYGVIYEEDAMIVNTRQMKILVFGMLAGNVSDYQTVAKKVGIPKNQIKFVSDYDEIKSYNTKRLEYSMEFSDIICGAMPHKIKGIEHTSSFIADARNNPEKYPRVLEGVANESLKLSISSFKECLFKTRFVENII